MPANSRRSPERRFCFPRKVKHHDACDERRDWRERQHVAATRRDQCEEEQEEPRNSAAVVVSRHAFILGLAATVFKKRIRVCRLFRCDRNLKAARTASKDHKKLRFLGVR